MKTTIESVLGTGNIDNDTTYRITTARYADGKCSLHLTTTDPNQVGWKTRAMRLCESVKLRWSNREKCYIGSPSQMKKWLWCCENMYDYSVIMKKLEPPVIV